MQVCFPRAGVTEIPPLGEGSMFVVSLGDFEKPYKNKLVKLCGPQHVELWQSIHIRDIMMARSEQTEGPNEGRRVSIARAQ